MDASELRDSNYLYLTKDNFKTVKVYQVDPFDIYKLSESECVDVKPIPLTEDWLLKFKYEYKGIVHDNMYESYKRYVLHNFIGDNSHEVHIITSTYGNTHHVEYTTSIDQHNRQYNGRMEFIHDLQNAVYKETGKELTIKDE